MNTWSALIILLAILLVGGSSAAAPGMDTVRTSPSSSAETEDHMYVLKPWLSLRTHLHNKAIHVPIGFALSAYLLSLLSYRWKEVQPAVRWLVLVAALGAVAAYVTGTNQAALLEGGSKDWVIEIHERLGITTGIMLWVWAGCCWIKPMRRWANIPGTLAVLLVTVTGFFGGVLAHG